jgi:hypothetical protein
MANATPERVEAMSRLLLVKPFTIWTVLKAAVVGLVLTLMPMSTGTAAATTWEEVTGTATSSGGDGFTTADFDYTSPGILGSGTMHFDFVLIFEEDGVRTEGTGVLTRSDGATLTGTETSTVEPSTSGFAVEVHFTVTSGSWEFAGFTGGIVLTGTTSGPGSIGDVFTMSGTLDNSLIVAGGPANQACVGKTISTGATTQPPGARGETISSFAQAPPTPLPGIGDGIQGLMAGNFDDDFVPNTCND